MYVISLHVCCASSQECTVALNSSKPCPSLPQVLTCPAAHNDSSDQRATCLGDLSNGDGSMVLYPVNESDVGFYTGMLFRSGRVHVCEFELHISEGELHSTEFFEFKGFGVDIRSS